MQRYELGNQGFKWGRRYFLWPFLIVLQPTQGMICTEYKDYMFILKLGKYSLKMPRVQRMSGSCKTTSWTFQHSIGDKFIFDLSFCWRPDVTYDYLVRQPNYKKAKEALSKI